MHLAETREQQIHEKYIVYTIYVETVKQGKTTRIDIPLYKLRMQKDKEQVINSP